MAVKEFSRTQPYMYIIQ